jgi:hypothetical protein
MVVPCGCQKYATTTGFAAIHIAARHITVDWLQIACFINGTNHELTVSDSMERFVFALASSIDEVRYAQP